MNMRLTFDADRYLGKRFEYVERGYAIDVVAWNPDKCMAGSFGCVQVRILIGPTSLAWLPVGTFRQAVDEGILIPA